MTAVGAVCIAAGINQFIAIGASSGGWKVAHFGREAVLLVVWVGAAAMAHGVSEIVLAFRLRELGRTPPPGRAVPA